MSHGICETVQIQMEPTPDNPDGVVIINKSDFVEGEHELYIEAGKEAPGPVSKAEATKAAVEGLGKTYEIPVQPWAKT